MGLRPTTRTGTTTSSPQSRTTRAPVITLRDHHSSWPRSIGPPQGRDPLGSPGDQPDYEDWYSEVESAGSCTDLTEVYAEYGEQGECSDITVESDRGSDQKEDPAMEMEELPQEDPLSLNDTGTSKGGRASRSQGSAQDFKRLHFALFSLYFLLLVLSVPCAATPAESLKMDCRTGLCGRGEDMPAWIYRGQVCVDVRRTCLHGHREDRPSWTCKGQACMDIQRTGLYGREEDMPAWTCRGQDRVDLQRTGLHGHAEDRTVWTCRGQACVDMQRTGLRGHAEDRTVWTCRGQACVDLQRTGLRGHAEDRTVWTCRGQACVDMQRTGPCGPAEDRPAWTCRGQDRVDLQRTGLRGHAEDRTVWTCVDMQRTGPCGPAEDRPPNCLLGFSCPRPLMLLLGKKEHHCPPSPEGMSSVDMEGERETEREASRSRLRGVWVNVIATQKIPQWAVRL
ncbi:hypothetical protein P4O66_021822 [Electrophorus voltai]|uniref:Uncharacterized protein n=1 Tax=Electrophorus voltai TaxID=2609070 RepID=A0AAD8ZML5_9TELE|nr:hypothetical protein P4O66_021822 [Electrophorus voltai]